MSNDTSRPHAGLPPNPVKHSRSRHVSRGASGNPDSWGGFSAVAAVVIIYVSAMFGAAVLLGTYAGLFRGITPQTSDWLTRSTEAQFLYILFNEGLTIFLLWAYMELTRRRKNVLRTLGLLRPRSQDVGFAVLGILAYLGIYVAIGILVGDRLSIDMEQKQDVGFENLTAHRDLVLVFFSLVVLPPLVEEIMFRGFLFSGLRKHLPFFLAMLVTSVLFGIPHLFGGVQGSGLLWIAGIDTFILSLVLCYLRERTGRLWAGMLVHAMKNGIAFWALFILK